MSRVVVIQARSGSSRLPGKALLTFHGLPLFVLAAKRAATTGRKTILATSTCSSDDALAAVAAEHGVDCFRGPLDDVLKRFVAALSTYADDTIVTRLTADNVVPNGELIDEIEQEFCDRGLEYITTTDRRSGLPHGVSVEMTKLAHLREADKLAETKSDREHVTPFIRRKFGSTPFMRYRAMQKSSFRTTVDCFDDFVSLLRVFPSGVDPVEIGWRSLVERLSLGLFQPNGDGPVDKFVLGAAQLGMQYGITNHSNLADDERRAMVKTAIGNGVPYIDTARAYGNSESTIGRVLASGWAGRCEVITKLSPLDGLGESASGDVVTKAVENSVLQSCVSLQTQRLGTLLLHRAYHLKAYDGRIWRQLCELRANGAVDNIGVSVQSPEELLTALEHETVSHIQLPYSVLDHRWAQVLPALLEVRERRALIVHVRSTLLQGLLASDDPSAWRSAHVSNSSTIRSWLKRLVKDLSRDDVPDLCLAWAQSQSWVDGVVVGCENLVQLERNIKLFRKPLLSADDIAHVDASRPVVGSETLDPAKWQAAKAVK